MLRRAGGKGVCGALVRGSSTAMFGLVTALLLAVPPAALAQISAVPQPSDEPAAAGAAPAAPVPQRRDQAGSKPAASRKSTPDRISLNFKDADIDSVVGAFGHLLNRAFLIDPRVRGKITLETPRPVTRARAFEMLQAALRVQGFAIVDTGTLARVVPEADAKLQASPVSIDTTVRAGDQVVTQIFRLNYESATNLVPVLRPLITPNNTITAYPSNNSLVVTDYAGNLKRLAQVIATLDSPSTSEVEVVTVKYAIASDIANSISRIIDDSSRGGQGAQVDPGQRITVLADPRMNAVMLRSSSAAKVNLAKTLIARMDQPSAQPGNINVVYLRNAEAGRLAQVLRGVLSGEAGAASGLGGMGFGGSTAGGVGTSGAGGTQSGFGQSSFGTQAGANSGTALGSSTGSAGMGGGSTAQSGQAGATSFNAGGAVIAADPSTNSLIITASEPVYRNLRAVIDRLDARRAQVYIESLIVEVSAEHAAEFGVQWQFLNGLTSSNVQGFGGTNFGARPAAGNILDVITNPLASVGKGLNVGVIKGTITVAGQEILNLGLLAQALETRANTNILATPNLVTLDNEEARILIGKNVPLISGSYAATGAVGGAVNPFQTIERRDIGTSLRVRPQVSESGTVKLQIFQEVSDVLEQTAQGLTLTKRAIESNVLVDDGQIVVLGGLIQEKVEGGEQKVPGLGDLPFFGQLFRYDTRKREKTNLLVFLRPVILRDANAAHGVTTDRYDYIRQLQGDSRLPKHWLLPAFPPSDLPEMPTAPKPDAKVTGPSAVTGPPASMSPDIERAVNLRRGPPAPVEESTPVIVRPPPAGGTGN